ncbi:Rap1a/Tai family immunity protein [Bradyrhizobium uaiense]|uniref:Rap1a immunity protein domain-containing protein n=1 Tax=Bradyrhizobium uaiense TaxID=2594946 RepID=A0A6P1BEM6_9BRAD|nr:Rap1a/Tai family immunity protein [Bradyrhizobium uaiense]NEU96031.1 hypothetical protein [Bradyrhizobium uaiense]
MRRLILAFITIVATGFPVWASDVTGEVLAFACMENLPAAKREKDSEKRLQFCNTYLNAWDDARYAFLKGTRTYCPPSITIKEMSVVFFDYMAGHREARDLPAAEALMLAFKAKWPCRD